MTHYPAPERRLPLNIVANVAAALLFAMIAGLPALFFVVPRVTHGAALSVLTGSMSPRHDLARHD